MFVYVPHGSLQTTDRYESTVQLITRRACLFDTYKVFLEERFKKILDLLILPIHIDTYLVLGQSLYIVVKKLSYSMAETVAVKDF